MKTKIINISKIYSWNIDSQQIEVVKNKDILIENDIIIEISSQNDNFDKIYDAKGCILTPGFIDSHTHPIFIGNRSEEFILRLSGSTYEEISSSGGGINYSIKKLRESSDDELFESSYKNISPFINYGTTTIEAKSGYGPSYIAQYLMKKRVQPDLYDINSLNINWESICIDQFNKKIYVTQ